MKSAERVLLWFNIFCFCQVEVAVLGQELMLCRADDQDLIKEVDISFVLQPQ